LFTVTWARDNRLVFVEHRAIGGKLGYQGWTGSDFSHVVVRSYSTALDGTDVREVAAPNDGQLEQVPSPDGRRLAAWDSEAEAVVITDIETGEITEIPVPGAFMIAEWSPAGDRLALAGPTESTEAPWAFFVLNADGTGLQSLGLGTGFAWMPAATADPED
jgi:hypothetical protein